MLPETVKALREEFAKLHTDANDLLGTLAKEGKDFTAEQKENQDKRFARMDTIKAQIDQELKLAKYEFQKTQAAIAAESGVVAGAGTAGAQAAAALASLQRGDVPDAQQFSKLLESGDKAAIAKAKKAVSFWMTRGEVGEEYKFTLTTGTNSGIMLPKQVIAPYLIRRNVNAFRRALLLTGYNPLETTTTAQIVLPVWDDTGNIGDAISESSTTNNTADSTTTGSVTLNGTLYESKCKWFSNTLLNAEGFDVLSYVAPVLMKMLDKAQESAYTTTALSAFTTNYTCPSETGVKYADLLAWEHTLAVAYRDDALFILADTLYKAFRGMVDSNNRPIIDLDPAGVIFDNAGIPQNAFIEKIHGKPVVVSDYLTALTNGSVSAGTEKCGLFVSGDAIKLRDVIPQRLTRYVNIPTFPDQTGYNLFANGDCQFVNAGGALFIY